MVSSALVGTPPSGPSAPISMRPNSLKSRLASGASTRTPSLTPSRGSLSGGDNIAWPSFSQRGSLKVQASSPSGSEASLSGGLRVKAPPTGAVNSIVGFTVRRDEAGESPSTRKDKPVGGLLSRALHVEPEHSKQQLLPSLPEHDFMLNTAGSGEIPAFFPGTDPTLLNQAAARHTIFHTELVRTAFMTAAHAYRGQIRPDGVSQLGHCVMTALKLAELGLSEEIVAAGLLHEVLVVNEHFRSQLEEFMPKPVVELVDRVTTISKVSQLHRSVRDSLLDEQLQNMLLAMKDVQAVLVALACRLHHMQCIDAMPRSEQEQLALETLEIFSPVANRLGVWGLKAELEDAAFKVLHPEEFRMLHAQVAERHDPAALGTMIQRIKEGLDKAGIKYEDISGRPKNLYGIWTKMKANGHTSLDQVFDVMALRVIVANKHDCYFVQRVVQGLYRCDPKRSKDFIKDIRKPNGYQSLHETIYDESQQPVEVQIRTHKMHYIAEYGFAAHWKYKENLNNEDEWLEKTVQYQRWVAQYKLGVHDKKVRANGSPTDSSLKSLGMHQLHGGRTEEVDPFLMHDRFKLQAPDHRSVSIFCNSPVSSLVGPRTYTSGITLAQVAEDLGVAGLLGRDYFLTVNREREVADLGMPLESGDLVQVKHKDELLSGSPPEKHPEVLAMLAKQMPVQDRQWALEQQWRSSGGSSGSSQQAPPSSGPASSVASSGAAPLVPQAAPEAVASPPLLGGQESLSSLSDTELHVYVSDRAAPFTIPLKSPREQQQACTAEVKAW